MDNVMQLVEHMGPMAIAVASVLLIMAGLSLAVFFERAFTFFRSRRHSRRFAVEARVLLEQGHYETLALKAEASKGHLAKLIAAGARAYLKGRKSSSKLAPVELARRELERVAETLAADLKKGMSVIASVGSIAPFVGLLGTVFGIITAFQGIAREGSGGLGAVSLGIAEALYETALGLVVAIPAVLAFNYLSGKADKLMLGLDQARGELVDHLELADGKVHLEVLEGQAANGG